MGKYISSMDAMLSGTSDDSWTNSFAITEEQYYRALIGAERAFGAKLIAPKSPYDWRTLRTQISEAVINLSEGCEWCEFQHLASLLIERMHKQFEYGWLPYTSGYCAVRQALYEAQAKIVKDEDDDTAMEWYDCSKAYMYLDCDGVYPDEFGRDRSGEIPEGELTFSDRNELSPVEWVDQAQTVKRWEREFDQIIAESQHT